MIQQLQAFYLSKPLDLHFHDDLDLEFCHLPSFANRDFCSMWSGRFTRDLKQFGHVIHGMQLSRENLLALARLAERIFTGELYDAP